ncbi:hypothetical protein A3C33_02350 [Candidatus Curtissbacteria bacterium RIFCSPHIGHO2_02_FULL_42_58]|nr:MAG: hypothetical protein A3C33_02350 [Candidatus Curtissbacteria bacterium RIFCSPHIGHO2_02_FULL_42_58]
MSRLEKTLLAENVIFYGLLSVFSYAYVDLNLTLSQNPIVINFVNFMQQLGYFHRPVATSIYVFFIIFAFSFFIFNLWLFYKLKIGTTYLKISTVVNTLILIFAYPFLSSDLFNYLFDAKIILVYHANPYTVRPLDFPQDEWLRFMRWVHRYSPYGPLWLGMSLIPAILGFGKFILNFLTFKIFISIFHLINAYLVFKILQKINPKSVLFGTAFYAINPLFLIEGIVNAHNDVVLATFLIGSVYFFVCRKTVWSYVALLAGTLIKYIPVLNLPWLLLTSLYPKFGNSNKLEKFKWLIWTNLAAMAAFTYLFSSFRITVPFVSSGATQVQFQPWYLFWTIPFIALVPRAYFIVAATIICLGASLRYIPYLYYGDWSQKGTGGFMMSLMVISLIIALIIIAPNLKFQKK